MKPNKPPSPKVRRRYPLHAVFLIYCLVSLLVAVGAFNNNNNLLFWLFGLSMGMLLVSGVISGTMMMSITVRRQAIEQPRVGHPLRIRYSITNRSRWLPVIGLTISERLAAHGTGDADHAASLASPPSGSVPHVPPGTTVTVETLALPTARGRLSLIGFDVLTTFPFGIIRKSLWHESPVTLIVHPSEVNLPEGLLSEARGSTGSGAAATRPGRLGDEPVGLREYRPGDAPKLVSWRASARRPNGDLLVRQNAEGSPRRLWVLLKLTSGATTAETEAALSAAASVIRAAALVGRGLHVGLSLRADWRDSRGRALALDVAPRAGGASVVLLNDLALMSTPAPSLAGASAVPAVFAGEPRIAASDIIIRVSPRGQIELQASAPRERRLQPHTVVGGRGAR